MLGWRNAKRIVVFVVGMTVVLFGVALIVLPGPAVVVIPLGVAILATEFVWAQRLLKKMKEKTLAAANSMGFGFPVAKPETGGQTPGAPEPSDTPEGGRDARPHEGDASPLP
jgi:hypothetical protein